MVYLSYYYLDNRNFEDTVMVLEKADKLNPDDVGIMLNLAIGYRGVERYDDAVKEDFHRAEMGAQVGCTIA